MYGYFTDCVVVQYAAQSNRLKLLPADSDALSQYGSQRGPVNTVMCMEYCDGACVRYYVCMCAREGCGGAAAAWSWRRD